MQLVPFTVELDETIYNEAKAVLEQQGHTMEEALVLFLKYLSSYKQIPFDCTEVAHQWERFVAERKEHALAQLMHELEKGATSGDYLDEEEVRRLLFEE